MSRLDEYLERGWLSFPFDRAVAEWAASAMPAALATACDPSYAAWLRCGGTWFVGLDALPNDAAGCVGSGPPLNGKAIYFIRNDLKLDLPLHRAQVSICYEGYPQPSEEETPAAYRFRVNRDAAHVDGLIAEGPEKRRHLKEPHAFILGLPLNDVHAEASPLVVWDGSHRIMREMFESILKDIDPARWPEIDVTEAYQAARRKAFETCERIALPVKAGQATLLHRHVLHGVAPWGAEAGASPDGRMIAYFRPEFPDTRDWLDTP